MIIRRLTVKNFLIFSEFDLDLSNVRLASIVGQFASDKRRSNGSGKTAFLEAIRYALFDQIRSKSKEGIIKSGESRCEVTLEVYADPNTISVTRVRTKSSSTCKVYVNGALSGDKTKVVNSVVEEYLGLDSDLFDLIYFFKQSDQFGFANASPSDRKSILARVFRLDDLEKCQASINVAVKNSVEKYDRSEGALDSAKSKSASLLSLSHLIQDELDCSDELACCELIQEYWKSVESDFEDPLRFITEIQNSWLSEVDNTDERIRDLSRRINQYSDQISLKQASLQQTGSEIDRLKSEINSIKSISDNQPDINQLQKSKDEAQNLFYELKAQAKSHQEKYESLGKGCDIQHIAGSKCHTCGQFVSADHVENLLVEYHRLADLEKSHYDEKIQKCDSIQKFLVEVSSQIDDANRVIYERSRFDDLKKSHQKMQGIITLMESEIDQLTNYRNDCIAEHSELCKQVDPSDVLEGKEFFKKEIESAKMIVSCAKYESSLNNTRMLEATAKLSRASSSLENRRLVDQELVKCQFNLAKSKRDVTIYKTLSEIFGKNGIQALIIDNTIGVIEKFANQILSEMQTRFVLQMRTQKQLKSGEDRESLDIIIFDNGEERSFESYSGGEKALINLSIRLSLSRVISSLHGVKLQSLFLDEVLGALDDVNREIVIKIVSYLSKSFDQVFIISHTDEVRDIIDTGIMIDRFDSHSTVRLTNCVEIAS